MKLIDTNIIVYAYDEAYTFHYEAVKIIKAAQDGDFEGCITTQNLLEFCSVITNPKRTHNPITSSEAIKITNLFWESATIKKILPSRNTYKIWNKLVKDYNISKAEIFDTYLVAMMIENDMFEVYTFNENDFAKYDFITIINPSK